MADNNSTSNRGLANADQETRERVASEGGKASGGNFAKDRAKAKMAGETGAEHQSTEAKRRGGQNSHRSE
jgi:general stress protein YciG